jgi:hypothetical protein
VLRVREHAPTPSPFNVFTFGLTVKSIKELGVHHMWFVRMIKAINGYCAIYIGNGVGDGSITMSEGANGQCGLQGLMRHDELKDMGHFVPTRKKKYYEHNLKNMFHFLKISYFY